MKYAIIKYGKEEKEKFIKKDNLRKKCYAIFELY